MRRCEYEQRCHKVGVFISKNFHQLIVLVQVVLGRHKQDHAKFAALKVVFLRNPELDEEHLEIMRK